MRLDRSQHTPRELRQCRRAYGVHGSKDGMHVTALPAVTLPALDWAPTLSFRRKDIPDARWTLTTTGGRKKKIVFVVGLVSEESGIVVACAGPGRCQSLPQREEGKKCSVRFGQKSEIANQY